eukprot:3757011-Alexandrium_andersonii.AAC.1
MLTFSLASPRPEQMLLELGVDGVVCEGTCATAPLDLGHLHLHSAIALWMVRASTEFDFFRAVYHYSSFSSVVLDKLYDVTDMVLGAVARDQPQDELALLGSIGSKTAKATAM